MYQRAVVPKLYLMDFPSLFLSHKKLKNFPDYKPSEFLLEVLETSQYFNWVTKYIEKHNLML